jgi:hypothetical protein
MTQKQYDFLPDDFFDRTPKEREEFLIANADEVKEEDFYKPLAHDERAELKDTLSDVSIDLSNKQAEYDEVKQHWREEIIKPLKEKRDSTIEKLKTGQEPVHGKVVYIRDHDNGRVIKMAPDGTELESRPMRPSERQTTTQSNIRNINQAK